MVSVSDLTDILTGLGDKVYRNWLKHFLKISNNMFSWTSLRLRSWCGSLTRMGTVTSTMRSLSRCSLRRRWRVQKFRWKCASSLWTAAWCEAPLVMIDRFPFRSNPSFPSENLNKSWHPPVSGCLAVCAVLISSPLSDVRLGPRDG